MKRHAHTALCLLLAALGLLSATANASQGAPKFVVMNEIKESGTYVVNVVKNNPDFESGELDETLAEELARRAKLCLDAINRGAGAGITDSTAITVEGINESWNVTIGELRTMCQRAAKTGGAVALNADIQSAVNNVAVWPSEISGNSWTRDQAQSAALSSKHLIELIDDAYKSGVPATQAVEIGENQGTLADAREMAEYVLAEANKVEEKALAALAAEMAPFVAALSGEKKAIYHEYHGMWVFGHGGRVLKTPADFASSTVWYTTGHNEYNTRWILWGTHFSGNKVVRRTRDEGWGTQPPSSAFR